MKVAKSVNYLIYEIAEYILALCMILNCRAMWLYNPYYGHKFAMAVNVSCICSALFCAMLKWKKNKKNLNAICMSLFWILYATMFIVATSYNIKNFVNFCLVVIVLMFYYKVCCNKSGIPSILFKYSNLISIIATISLVIWLLGQIMGIIKPTGYIVTIWSHTGDPISVRSFYGIQFWPQTITTFAGFEGVFPRNSAFFSETPMAAFQFVLAFMIESLLKQRKNLKKMILLLCAIVSTFSTTAYLIAIIVLTVLYITGKPKLKLIEIVRIISIPTLAIFAYLVAYSILMEKMGNRSGTIRVDDFVVGFNAWKDAPIFGHGYENNDILKQYMQSWRSVNSGFSNALMQILAQGGVFLFLPYAVAFLIGIKNAIKSRKVLYIIFSFCFIIAFALNLVSYQYIVILIAMFMLNYKPDSKNWIDN